MTKLTKSVRRAKKTVEFTHPRLYQRQDYESFNSEALKGILGYLKYLYLEGEISDRAYKVLVSYALSTFVENLISPKLDIVFNDVDLALREASESLLADILA